MPTRVGIEVSPGRCRLVETELRASSAAKAAAPVRVRHFHSFEWDSADPSTLTAGLKGARATQHLTSAAWVTLWGVPSAFRFLQLPPANPLHIEAIARREAEQELTRLAPLPGDAASSVILGGMVEGETPPRREVAFVAASASDVRARIAPVTAAGFSVGGVLIPSMALVSLARLVPAGSPGKAVAYLALDTDASAIVITRDGVPLFARELAWGYHGYARLADREALVTRLASELRRSFLLFKQTFRQSVELLAICGDYHHELRSLTAPLMTALELDIEMLDAPAGIDLNALPEPESRFREEIAALRIAWATAVDANPPVNLLPRDVLAGRARRRQTLILGASAAAGIALAAALYVPADRQADREEARVQLLREDLARMEPLAREQDLARQTSAVAEVQKVALQSMGEQGPRLARALEQLAAATPEGLTLTSLSVRAAGAAWSARIAGIAIADNPAAGSSLVNQFLRAVDGSPYFGSAASPPSLRVLSATRAAQPAEGTARPAIPEGKSGVEFSVEFALPR